MEIRSETFNLTLNNIPHINLRNEFARYYSALKDDDFVSQFEGEIKHIRTPYMVWYGMPDDLITLILQRVIMGLESYLPGAVYFELGYRGRLKENIKLIENPYKLGGNGTVDNYYHRLPKLVEEKFSLKIANAHLWSQTRAFYTEVRNPIFHGNHITNRNAKVLRQVFNYLEQIYIWIDSWHNYEQRL